MSDYLISATYEKLLALAEKTQSIRLYPPADIRLSSRSISKIPGKFDSALQSFYELSNGASLLDYCILGCKNPRIRDVADHTLSLWATNDSLALDFVGFMTTSAGQEFGYLQETNSGGAHVVAVLPELSSQSMLPLASSVGSFLRVLTMKLAVTIEADPMALYVSSPADWPFNLGEWLAEDSELKMRYLKGDFDRYFAKDPIFLEIVNDSL